MPLTIKPPSPPARGGKFQSHCLPDLCPSFSLNLHSPGSFERVGRIIFTRRTIIFTIYVPTENARNVSSIGQVTLTPSHSTCFPEGDVAAPGYPPCPPLPLLARRTLKEVSPGTRATPLRSGPPVGNSSRDWPLAGF